MITTGKKYFKKLCYLVLFCLLTVGVQAASAQPAPDTVNTADLQFTSITNDTTVAMAKPILKVAPSNRKADKIAGMAIPAKTPLSLWAIFITGFIGGLAALLLPYIFPMLPLTVGFFTKRHDNPKKGILDAAIYGLSIITFSHRKITTIGGLNSDIQATRFNTNSQPYYVLLNPVTETTLVTPEGADYHPENYYRYLESGINLFK